MKLGDYLTEKGESQSDFAKRIDLDRFRVSKLVHGKIIPALDLAFRIERATGGMVKAETWLPAERSRR